MFLRLLPIAEALFSLQLYSVMFQNAFLPFVTNLNFVWHIVNIYFCLPRDKEFACKVFELLWNNICLDNWMHLSSFVGVFFFFKKWVVIVLQWGLSLKRLVYWTQLLSLKYINMLHLCSISCVKGKLRYYYSIYSVKSLPKWGACRGLFVPILKLFSTPGIYLGSLEDSCGSQIAALLQSSLCCSLGECDGLLCMPGKLHFSPGRVTCWHLSGSPICQDTWASL